MTIEQEPSPAWSHARVDLAAQAHGHARYAEVAEHACAVIEAPVDRVDPGARAVAGILLCDAREALDLDVDLVLLATSIDAAVALGHHYYAGSGLTQRGRLLQQRGDRAGAEASFKRALDELDATESALAAPGVLFRLGTLARDDGDYRTARAYVAEALLRLDKFPLAGKSALVMRDKLIRLRESLG